jgi:hypothetical protein
MAKKIEDIEVEEVTTDYSRIGDGWNPLGENVIEREYTKAGKVDLSSVGEIKEPSFEPPVLENLESHVDDSESTSSEGEEDDFGWDSMRSSSSKGNTPPDDDLEGDNELSPSEKRKASEALVDGVLEGYIMLHQVGARWFSVSEDKLVERAMKGEIDLDMPIPISETQVISVQEFVQSYNQSVQETLVVEDEFIEKVRPPLIRIAQKNNIGLSDEALVGIMFAKDLGMKGVALFGLKKSFNKTLDMVTKMYRQQQSQGMNVPPPPPPPPTSPSGGQGNDFTPPPTEPTYNQPPTEDGVSYEPVEEVNMQVVGASERMGTEDIERRVRESNTATSGDIVFDIETEEDIVDSTIDESPMEIIPPNSDMFKEEEEK